MIGQLINPNSASKLKPLPVIHWQMQHIILRQIWIKDTLSYEYLLVYGKLRIFYTRVGTMNAEISEQ